MDNWYDWHRPDRLPEVYTVGYYWRKVLGFGGSAKE